MTRRWLLHGNSADGPLIERILAARGFCDPAAIEQFCEPKLSGLHEPALMPGVDAASERIVAAIRAGQRIVIYGDYDVDGITAAAILYHTIKTIQPEANLHTYVPHRMEEGYGINCDALKQLRSDGADLVISVDCGITAAESARTAKEIGLDLIITDHHNPPEHQPLPEATAIVHPRLPGSRYPFGALCGAGVAFKLAWRLAVVWCNSERVSESLQKTLLNMLPLAALGTIADVVPLVDENRVLASFGLRLIRQTPLVGLRALIEASELMGENIDCEKVGYVLAPRLNACGRLGHAREVVHMLCGASPEEAIAIARDLTAVNERRQRTERDIYTHALRMAEDLGMTGDDTRAIVLAHHGWHPGVVGIVCSRLAERFARPAVLMQRNGEFCKGSGRSVEGYSLHAGLNACAELLSSFGGHDMAAGMVMPVANYESFVERFIAHANEHIVPENLMPAVHVDCDATLDELDMATVQGIGKLSPFGRSNRKPVLRIAGASLSDAPRQIGPEGRHLMLRLRQTNGSGQVWMRAVWWRAGSHASDLAVGQTIDAAVEPRINEWNGRVSVELEIKDVMVREAQVGRAAPGLEPQSDSVESQA
jgi:single-stranded-DNA-specific exonuclease